MNTRDEIVYIADSLIRTVGYNAFSYSDIGESMRIRPAAIHYHFHTKTDLGLEVVRQELRRVRNFRLKALVLPGGDQLKRLFGTFWRQSVEHRLCLIGSLTHDFATFDEPMQNAVKGLCSEIAEWVADCLEKERKEGRMKFKGTAGDRAMLVLSTLMSSLMLGRALDTHLYNIL